jgi:HlyD family secretion protein
LDERRNALTLPESCLIFDNDSAFVDVSVRGEFERKHIVTDLSDCINIEVVSGIDEKERIKK